MAHELMDYRVLIVRAWAVQPAKDAEPAWRYIIETPNTGKRRGFSTLQSLLDALDRELVAVGADSQGGIETDQADGEA